MNKKALLNNLIFILIFILLPVSILVFLKNDICEKYEKHFISRIFDAEIKILKNEAFLLKMNKKNKENFKLPVSKIHYAELRNYNQYKDFIEREKINEEELSYPIEKDSSFCSKNYLYIFNPLEFRGKTLLYIRIKYSRNNYINRLKNRYDYSILIMLSMVLLLIWKFKVLKKINENSIKYKFYLLFFILLFIPLVIITYFGVSYLFNVNKVLKEDKVNEIGEELKRLDNFSLEYRKKIEGTFRKFFDEEIVKFTLKRKEDYKAQLVIQNSELKDYIKRGIIDRLDIIDESGEFIFSYNNEENNEQIFNSGIMSSVAQIIIQHFNKGIKLGDRKVKQKNLLSKIMVREYGVLDKLVVNMGKIHKLELIGMQVFMYLDAVLDSDKKALATFGVVINRDKFYEHLIRLYIEQNNSNRNNRIKLFAGRKDHKTIGNKTENSEIDENINKIMVLKTEIIQEITLEDKKYLMYGNALKLLKPYSGAGIYSYEYIDEAFYNDLYIFIIILIFTVIVSILISIIIRKKFLIPVNNLNEGINAVAEEHFGYRMSVQSNDELGNFSNIFNTMMSEIQEKTRMEKYVSSSVLKEIKNENNLASTKKATVLFTHIKQFTEISGKYPPEEILKLLNSYLEGMTSIILRNGGVIDKFIGDAIMAVFYPEENSIEDEIRAIICGLQMRDELERINYLRDKEDKFIIDTGIGINTGNVIKGNIGSPDHRIDLTVIGDNVNIAARLESLSYKGVHTKIIVSENTMKECDELFEFEYIGKEKIKGKKNTFKLYEVKGIIRNNDYVSILDHEEPKMIIHGLRILGILKNATYDTDKIIKKLNDKDKKIRIEAGYALEKILGENCSKDILRCLKDEEDNQVKASFIKILGNIGDDSEKVKLELFLGDPDDRVRANTIEALGNNQNKERIIRTLNELKHDPDNRIRANSCVMLWNYGVTDSLSELITMTESRNHLMRASGAWGIGEIGNTEKLTALKMKKGAAVNLVSFNLWEKLDDALESLYKLLDDENNIVLRNAVKALGKVGNRHTILKLTDLFSRTKNEDIKFLALKSIEEIGSYNTVKYVKRELRKFS